MAKEDSPSQRRSLTSSSRWEIGPFPPHRWYLALVCVACLTGLPLEALADETSGPGGSSSDPKGQVEASPDPQEKNPIARMWEESAFKHQTTVGLYTHEGVDSERVNFRPNRELRILEKGSLAHESQSVHWNLRLQVNRDAVFPGSDLDEDYSGIRRNLVNGSMITNSAQLMVRGLYWQKAEETWTLQLGTMQHIWGPADGINTLTVMNPQDLRFGLVGDKDSQYLSIPSGKLSLTQGSHTLSVVYAPWAQASLLPESVHNYNLRLDNQNFDTAIKSRDQITVSPSVAVKFDTSIAGADLTALLYQGVDYDPLGVPTALNVRNNRPLELELHQRLARKTSFGIGYNQVLGAWALKAEALYTPRKKVLPSIDGTKIEELSLPVEPRDGAHIASNVGFNYFTPIRNFFGIALGETVLTTEYFRQRIYGKGLFPALLSDIVLANLRTAALDDQLEINLSHAWDLALKGELLSTKLTYAGTTLNHSFVFTSIGGRTPEGAGLGAPFYYWRRNDSVAYEISYAIK